MPDLNNSPRPAVMEAGRDAVQNPDAPLPINEAKAIQAEARRTPDGKAIAETERGKMYEDLEGVGVSGTQAGTAGVEDLNPVGPRP